MPLWSLLRRVASRVQAAEKHEDGGGLSHEPKALHDSGSGKFRRMAK